MSKKTHKNLIDIIEDVTSIADLKKQGVKSEELEKDDEETAETDTPAVTEADKPFNLKMEGDESEDDEVKLTTEEEEVVDPLSDDEEEKEVAIGMEEDDSVVSDPENDASDTKQKLVDGLMKKLSTMSEEELLAVDLGGTPEDEEEVIVAEDDVTPEDEEEVIVAEDDVTSEDEEDKLKLTTEDDEEEVTVDDTGKVVTEEDDEEDDEIDMSADIAALTDKETKLTEGFKSKAKIIFEAAVKNKIKIVKAKLNESFLEKVKEAKRINRNELITKVDTYLQYVVEEWIKDNDVAITSNLRTEIAECFISSLRTTFSEHYIECPSGKKDLVEQLSKKVSSLEKQLAVSVKNNSVLKTSSNKLQRNAIISEASKGLASTQVSKLNELVSGILFESAETFQKKVLVIRESYFGAAKSAAGSVKPQAVSASNLTRTTKVIVEGSENDETSHLSNDMQRYLGAISRIEKNNPNGK